MNMAQLFQTVWTPDDLRAAEQAVFDGGMPSLLLMEHAAGAVIDALEGALGGTCENRRALFLCGTGNNGGDGLAAARIFMSRGGCPVIWLKAAPKTPDAKTNLALAKTLKIEIRMGEEALQDDPHRIDFDAFDGFVDALLGIGISGAPDELTGKMIRTLNREAGKRSAPVIAVDVPSGLDAASGLTPGGEDACVCASETVTFHGVKPGLLLTGQREKTGKLTVAEIGLKPFEELGLLPPRNEREKDLRLILPKALSLLPGCPPGAHKGDRGRVLIYAGSMGMAGAAAVCARAAVVAGAGLTTVVCDDKLMPILQTLAPNAMCVTTEKALQETPAYDALALGCGLGQSDEKWRNILKLWDSEKPSVWDADALNMLSLHPMMLGGNAVMTPHPGEAARLLHVPVSEIMKDRLQSAARLSREYGCTVLLKSDVTAACRAADGDPQWILNASGTPSLSKGGSGDALCGMLCTLLAQGKNDILTMAALASLWHALAARVGEKRFGTREMTACELLSCLHEAEEEGITMEVFRDR